MTFPSRTTLTVASNNFPPHFILTDGVIDGIESYILRTIGNHLNVTYKVIDCNNNFTRIDSQLKTKQADFAISDIYIMPHRLKFATFTSPYIIDTVTFTTPVPEVIPNMVSLLTPFDHQIWSFFVLYLGLVFVINYMIIGRKDCELFWSSIEVILRQSKSFEDHFERQFIWVWLLMSVVLTNSYSACIYSHLTGYNHIGKVDTISQLIEALRSKSLRIICRREDTHYDSIMRSQNGIYSKIAQYLEPVATTEEAYNRLKTSESKYAFIETKDNLRYNLQVRDIKTYTTPDTSGRDSTFDFNFIAIAMKKGFEYERQFKRIISNIMKGGLIRCWSNKFYLRRFKMILHRYVHRNGNSNFKIVLSHIYTLIIVLIIGSNLSIFVLCFEMVLSKFIAKYKPLNGLGDRVSC